jgi:hypothetical protein
VRGRFYFFIVLAIVLPLTSISCGGGGGGGPSISDLAGTWFGVLVDNDFEPHTYEVTMDSSGNMDDFYMDEVSFPTLSGTVSKESDRIFTFVFNDGTEGGFITDRSGSHIAFLNEDFLHGVMELGATDLPAYSATNYYGSWRGYSAWLDNDMAIVDEGPTDITVSEPSQVSGTTLNGEFEGTIVMFTGDPGYGVVGGVNDAGTVLFEMALSADKSFIATAACVIAVDIDINDCEFGAWTRR